LFTIYLCIVPIIARFVTEIPSVDLTRIDNSKPQQHEHQPTYDELQLIVEQRLHAMEAAESSASPTFSPASIALTSSQFGGAGLESGSTGGASDDRAQVIADPDDDPDTWIVGSSNNNHSSDLDEEAN